MNRRIFIKGMAFSTAALSVMAAGLTLPKELFAAWNKKAFESDSIDAAVKSYFGSSKMEASSSIKITAPNIAENGAVVPVTIDAGMNAESIAIFVKNNPFPLIAAFSLPKGAKGIVSTRIKMAKTSDLYAVVKSGGKLYENHKEIKVTIGGCGG